MGDQGKAARIAAFIGRADIIINYFKERQPGRLITGIEVGVWKGDMFALLLDMEPNLARFYGVDPYQIYSGQWKPWSQYDWDALYLKAFMRMRKYGDRAVLIREKSEEVCERLPVVDFVELDGDHSYQTVKRELEMYEPKVRSGGLFCGHDYYKRHTGVSRAVDEYAKMFDRQLHTAAEGISMWWWEVP